MRRAVLIIIAAVTASVAPADAAKRHKRYPGYTVPVVSRVAPATIPQTGPRWWVGPPQCWSDEGYGRYTSCDNGGKGG